jgi:hypothetical protein
MSKNSISDTWPHRESKFQTLTSPKVSMFPLCICHSLANLNQNCPSSLCDWSGPLFVIGRVFCLRLAGFSFVIGWAFCLWLTGSSLVIGWVFCLWLAGFSVCGWLGFLLWFAVFSLCNWSGSLFMIGRFFLVNNRVLCCDWPVSDWPDFHFVIG